MPKDNIDDITSTGFRVEVGWSGMIPGERDGHVQVAAVNTESPFTWEMLPLSDGSDPDSGGRFDGWHITLDREGINRLIRSLRKARDAAYGADA